MKIYIAVKVVSREFWTQISLTNILLILSKSYWHW